MIDEEKIKNTAYKLYKYRIKYNIEGTTEKDYQEAKQLEEFRNNISPLYFDDRELEIDFE